MAVRRRPRQREAQLAFEALSIEGGLLSPDWLSRVGQLSAGAQTEADYRVPKGLNLRDEIGRYWRIAQAHWRDFDSGGPPALTRGRWRSDSYRPCCTTASVSTLSPRRHRSWSPTARIRSGSPRSAAACPSS